MLFSVEISKMKEVIVTRPSSEHCVGPIKARIFDIGLQSWEKRTSKMSEMVGLCFLGREKFIAKIPYLVRKLFGNR